MRQKRPIKPPEDLPNLQTSQECCKLFFLFHKKSDRTQMSRPFARYHKNRKAKSAHLLLKILCPIKPLASLELVSSCLRDKLQLCKPFSSDHSDSNTKFGASLILIKARAFHPHPAPLRALPRFRELE